MRMNIGIKAQYTYMLLLHPLVMAVTVFLYHYLGGEVSYCGGDGLIRFPFLENLSGRTGMIALGTGLLLLLSYLLFFISDRYKSLSVSTVFPALFYSFLSIGVLCRYGFNSYLIAAFMVVLAIFRLFHAIIKTNSNAALFDFGLMIIVAVLICPKLVLLIPWAILVLPFSGRATLKDMMALFVGFIVPLIFVGGYYWQAGQLETVSSLFTGSLFAGVEFTALIQRRLAVMLTLFLLVLLSFIQGMMHTSTLIVSQRRLFFSMLSLLLFLAGTLVVLPFSCMGFWYVLFVPLSYLYASYFTTSCRSRWMSLNAFLLLLAGGVLMFI